MEWLHLLSACQIAFLSWKSNVIQQKCCCLSAELSGVDLDATLEKSEIKIDQKMYAQPAMVVVSGRAEIKYEYTYLWVLTFIKCTMCQHQSATHIYIQNSLCDLVGIINIVAVWKMMCEA